MRSGSLFSWIWVMPLLSLLQEGFWIQRCPCGFGPWLGDAIAIGISAFLESISNREDSHYTLGSSALAFRGHGNGSDSHDRVRSGYFRKYNENISPTTCQRWGHSLAWNHSRQHQCASESRHSQRGKPRTNPFSACIFWKILWAGWLSSYGHCPPIYRLVYSGSALISCHFHLYSVKSHSTFLEHAQDFLGCRARRSRYPASQEWFGRGWTMSLVSISSIFGPWMVWKKTPLSMFVWCQAYGGL